MKVEQNSHSFFGWQGLGEENLAWLNRVSECTLPLLARQRALESPILAWQRGREMATCLEQEGTWSKVALVCKQVVTSCLALLGRSFYEAGVYLVWDAGHFIKALWEGKERVREAEPLLFSALWMGVLMTRRYEIAIILSVLRVGYLWRSGMEQVQSDWQMEGWADLCLGCVQAQDVVHALARR